MLRELIKGYEDRFGAAVIISGLAVVSLVVTVIIFLLFDTDGGINIVGEGSVAKVKFVGAGALAGLLIILLILLGVYYNFTKSKSMAYFIKGTVFYDGKPVPSVSIVIVGDNRCIKTDENGYFHAELTPNSREWLLAFSYKNKTMERKIQHNELGESLRIDLTSDDAISQYRMDKLADEYLKLGIDLGFVSSKKHPPTPYICVKSLTHYVKISGKDAYQEFTIEGVICSDVDVAYTEINIDADNPTSVPEMNIQAIDLLSDKKLNIICDDFERNFSKLIKIYFPTKLHNGDNLKIKVCSDSKGTMVISGKDYILFDTNYKESVENFTLIVEFSDNSPERLELVNLNSGEKTPLFMDQETKLFSWTTSSKELPYLKDLKGFVIFDRKQK